MVKAEFQVGGEHPEKALTAEPDWTLKIPQTPWTWDSSSAASSALGSMQEAFQASLLCLFMQVLQAGITLLNNLCQHNSNPRQHLCLLLAGINPVRRG